MFQNHRDYTTFLPKNLPVAPSNAQNTILLKHNLILQLKTACSLQSLELQICTTTPGSKRAFFALLPSHPGPAPAVRQGLLAIRHRHWLVPVTLLTAFVTLASLQSLTGQAHAQSLSPLSFCSLKYIASLLLSIPLSQRRKSSQFQVASGYNTLLYFSQNTH